MRAYDFLKEKYDLSDDLAGELAKELEGKEEGKWDYHCIKWLIERFGKKEGWDYIHNRCFRIIRGIVKRLLSGDGAITEDREDFEMEIEWELYKCIEKYKGEGSLGRYIYAIGKRIRKKIIRVRNVVYGGFMDEYGDDEEDGEDLWDERESLRGAISLLPKDLRELFLYRSQGYLWKEIANFLQCPEGTVRRRFCEVKRQLRKFLK
ncbi:sigma-70 family RNA polymerase sigma factor [bacterium]|nr:sigma-70 family RNA polymerase sigma factor [bacterium]